MSIFASIALGRLLFVFLQMLKKSSVHEIGTLTLTKDKACRLKVCASPASSATLCTIYIWALPKMSVLHQPFTVLQSSQYWFGYYIEIRTTIHQMNNLLITRGWSKISPSKPYRDLFFLTWTKVTAVTRTTPLGAMATSRQETLKTANVQSSGSFDIKLGR